MKRVLSVFMSFILIFTSLNIIPYKTKAYTNPSYFNKIRIGLKSMANTSLNITLNGDYLFNNEVLTSGSTYSLTLNGTKIIFRGQAYDEINLFPLNYDSALLTIQSGTTINKYQGDFKFKIIENKIFPINSLYIEDYLKGVVGFEMSDYFPIEALKAQAVAARNYTLTNLNLYKNLGFDLNDTIECQVYGGYNDKLKNVIRAVDETRGQVQLYNETLVQAFYSASNGGYTEATENVWSTALPYCVIKQDTFDNEAWKPETITYTSSQLNTLLKQRAVISQTDTFIKLDINSITRYPSGRVASIDVIYKDISGAIKKITLTKSRTRTAFSVPSSLYTLTYNSATDSYSFTGKGNGHGVGLSQIGAKNRASAGQTFKDILAFYYHGSYTTSLLPKITEIITDRSKVIINQPVNVTVISSGGSNTGYLYKYEIYNENNLIYSTDYSDNNTHIFTPNYVGEYTIKAYMKDKLSNSNYDDVKEAKVMVYPNVLIDSININKTKLFTQDEVIITPETTGGTGNYLYSYKIIKDQNIISETQYSTDNKFKFTPNEKGEYRILVNVKDIESINEVDNSQEVTFVVFNRPYINKFDVTSPAFEKRNVDLKVTTNEGSDLGLKYKFEIFKENALIIQSDFMNNNSISFIPQQFGEYKAKVYILDNLTENIEDVKEFSFTVNEEPVKVSKLPIYWGMRGNDVVQIQSALTFLGYNIGTIDGIFGSKTYNGVVSFQKSVGLNATGTVDAATLKALNDAYIEKLSKK
ncbi:SpoIID/LytB domain-containing protein [Thermobrachium celere]|uniref:SpoIID/LytB domain n=1 Tax=Thermobrachium celere DSM 8682 TaxID=941824 RepID=R7RQX7_9CLOT|nr:SpoIID/LytB domain-containing protein [Thermobrachium celere]CDF58592.1 SpoIID/LytB domain [Thermobrachium celere DSM 8682]